MAKVAWWRPITQKVAWFGSQIAMPWFWHGRCAKQHDTRLWLAMMMHHLYGRVLARSRTRTVAWTLARVLARALARVLVVTEVVGYPRCALRPHPHPIPSPSHLNPFSIPIILHPLSCQKMEWLCLSWHPIMPPWDEVFYKNEYRICSPHPCAFGIYF